MDHPHPCRLSDLPPQPTEPKSTYVRVLVVVFPRLLNVHALSRNFLKFDRREMGLAFYVSREIYFSVMAIILATVELDRIVISCEVDITHAF